MGHIFSPKDLLRGVTFINFRKWKVIFMCLPFLKCHLWRESLKQLQHFTFHIKIQREIKTKGAEKLWETKIPILSKIFCTKVNINALEKIKVPKAEKNVHRGFSHICFCR